MYLLFALAMLFSACCSPGMDKADVLDILKQLANGRDPQDGQYFPSDRKTIQALSYAIGVLEHSIDQGTSPKKPAGPRRSPLPRNAGKPWNEQEDLLLTTEFDNGMSIEAIATKHQRTPLSISSRLVKLGKLDAAAEDPSGRLS